MDCLQGGAAQLNAPSECCASCCKDYEQSRSVTLKELLCTCNAKRVKAQGAYDVILAESHSVAICCWHGNAKVE